MTAVVSSSTQQVLRTISDGRGVLPSSSSRLGPIFGPKREEVAERDEIMGNFMLIYSSTKVNEDIGKS
jgi:hypothetical protein